MKNHKPHVFSYLAALVMGVILFAAFWETFLGSVSRPVGVAGIGGVTIAVIFFLVLGYRKSSGEGGNK